MSPKFVLILYCLLPPDVFGQAAVMPRYSNVESDSFSNIIYFENKPDNQGNLHFPTVNVNFPVFGQHTYREPLSLTSIIHKRDSKTGVSATGGLIYTEGDDVFAYAHYGRTGKLIWRISPIANNMMATRWSLANLSIFRRTASTQFQVN